MTPNKQTVEPVPETDALDQHAGDLDEQPALVNDVAPVDAVGAEGSTPDDAPHEASPRRDRLETEGDVAADFLEDLLDIADLDGDIDMDVDGNRAAVSIVGGDLSDLVGSDGEVLEALQELTRLAVLRETGERSRLMLDIAGHRQRRRDQLATTASEAIEMVQASAERLRLAPMSAFERKVVHDVVAAAGMVSESEGAEPNRCVVILPPDADR